MKNALFVLLALLVSNYSQAYTGSCADDKSVCSFYCKASETLNCDKSNYLVGYGYRYCHRFLENQNEYSQKGRIVLAKIRSCLVSTLAHDRTLACENSKKLASASHVPCYVNSGFCDLIIRDQLVILSTVKGELRDKEFQKVSEQVMKICAAQSL